jgi:hypothetical protein
MFSNNTVYIVQHSLAFMCNLYIRIFLIKTYFDEALFVADYVNGKLGGKSI